MVGQQAAVAVRSTSPAPLLWLLGLRDRWRDGEEIGQTVVVWMRSSSKRAPTGALAQTPPPSLGTGSRCRGLSSQLLGHLEFPESFIAFSTCLHARWASAESGTGLLMFCLRSEGLRSWWLAIPGILSFPSASLTVRQE